MASTTRFCAVAATTTTASLSALPLRLPASASATAASIICRRGGGRSIHHQSAQPAKVVPVYGTGPPPDPPTPAPEYSDASVRIARRRRQAELLSRAKDIRASAKGAGGNAAAKQGGEKEKPTGLRKRFWKDVGVKEVDGMLLLWNSF